MFKRSLFSLVVVALLAAGGYFVWGRLQETVKMDPPQLVSVKRGMFVHEILERGNLESARNTEIKCMVESQYAGTNIVIKSVIDEGTMVEEGDILIELDSPTLLDNLQNQETSVLSAIAQLTRSQADLKSTEIALKEYLQGVYNQERTAIQNRLFSAEEAVKLLENDLTHSEKLLEKGYITDAQVDAAIIEIDKARNTQKMETINLDVYQKLTREKRIAQLEAAVLTAEANVALDERFLGIRKTRLTLLQEQVERCTIRAPRAGQVVYYVSPRMMGNDDSLIREGLRVMERQILLQLPDPTQMQVRGLVNEANVRLVKRGQKAAVRLEAFPDQVFDGAVKSVNDFPEPGNFMGMAMSKEYAAIVTILNPPEGIKTGLTAEARITVNRIPDALLLPTQAVFAYGDKMYAVTYKEGKWDKVEIKTGAANDKEVVVLEGLNEGDQVVLGAWTHRDKIELPKLEGRFNETEDDDFDEEAFLEQMRREEMQQRGGPGQRGPGGRQGGGPGGGPGGSGGSPSGGGTDSGGGGGFGSPPPGTGGTPGGGGGGGFGGGGPR